jgi:energy-coupling factor transporter transmembrane protein EcfT
MINLGQYIPGETVVHRLDPRVKIVAVIAMSLLIFAASGIGIVLTSFFLAGMLRTSRLSLAKTADALRPVVIFMALIFFVHLLMTEGKTLLSFSPLPIRITQEGIVMGAYVTWQFTALVISAAILTMTTLPSDLVNGIERLLRPLARVGIPSQEIAVMISIALQFMPMLLMEYGRLRMAQMARGADFSTGSLALRTKALTALAIPLMLSAFRRADELTLAMEARGYHRGPRTTLHELRLTGTDMTAFTVMAAFALINIILKVIA